MNSPNSIQSLADARIIEAECLFGNGHYDMAFYVSGYAVELYLKARICTILNIPDFYDFDNRKKFENEDNITKPYKVHNFTQLLILAGLKSEQEKMLVDPNFRKDWAIIEKWKENHRYSIGKMKQDVADFISSTKNYTSWIRQYL